MRFLLRLCLTLTLAITAVAPGAIAQGFGPAIKVNDQVVTKYELDQRIRMLRLFRTQGDVNQLAEDQLIEDRLRLQAARDLGIAASDEELQAGMEEFAGRANLTAEQFMTALGRGGVAPESFRDFVRAGVSWRGVVQARFGSRVNVTEQEIDRAIATGGASGSALQVLMSEVFLPLTPGEEEETRELAARISRMGGDAFAQRHHRPSD